jgi:hypothetical protein
MLNKGEWSKVSREKGQLREKCWKDLGKIHQTIRPVGYAGAKVAGGESVQGGDVIYSKLAVRSNQLNKISEIC